MDLKISLIVIGLLVTSAIAAPPAIGIPGAMPCSSRDCEMDSDPVCAVDDSGVALTFSNRCMAELANCISGIYYAVIKHGEC